MITRCFFVKGSNPITLYHFPDLGLYIYASTKEIMKTALKNSGLKESYDDIKVNTGDIIQINSDGKIFCDTFETLYHFDWHDWYSLKLSITLDTLTARILKLSSDSQSRIEPVPFYSWWDATDRRADSAVAPVAHEISPDHRF